MLGVVPAAAQRFTVPGGTLADALSAIGRQGAIDIGGADAGLARTAVRGFSLDGSPREALARLLRDTDYRAVPLAGGGFRIVRRPRVAAVTRAIAAAAAPSSQPLGDIVVTAGKRERLLSTFPGGEIVLQVEQGGFGPTGATASQWLLSRSPVLQSTELGPGRNKYFIRGIADSSFTGPTQTTVSTYFGEVRIGYNGPDPNLNLYDVDRVEILEGPQGTLYGAGSIGGIIRLTPNAPLLDRAAASAELGVSATRSGDAGYDAAAMVNFAPWRDRAGLRLVAYRNRQGGYVDAAGRSDVNALTQTGGRAALRLKPLDAVTLDLSYLAQNSEQPDLQYANPAMGRLRRNEALAQPFDDHFRLARGVLEQRWGSGLTLRLAAARIDHDTRQRYDATPITAMTVPLAYDQATDIALTTAEAHLARSTARGGGWLVGISGVWDRTSTGRTFGALATPRELIGVTNRTQEKAVFAEWTLALGTGTAITAGGRYTAARMDGQPSRKPVNRDFINGQTTRRFDPELGFTQRLFGRLQWYGQYTQGFRTGGLAVARGTGRVATYESDHVAVGQAGLRLFRTGRTGLSGYAAVAYARWTNIQADLVARNGFPYTANVGDGRILTFEGSADWIPKPLPDVRLRGAIVLTRSRLVDPLPDFVGSGSRPLPASPSVTAVGRAAWAHDYGRHVLRGDVHVRYTGRSRLGVGPVLDIPYGDYAEFGAGGAIVVGRIELSLGLENMFDARANRFAIGNPFAVAFRNEATPLRPRTLRLGLRASL